MFEQQQSSYLHIRLISGYWITIPGEIGFQRRMELFSFLGKRKTKKRLFGNKGKCRKCGRKILTTTEFKVACREAGFVEDRATGKFKMKLRSGVVFLDGNPAWEQAKFNEIEKQRGYQCEDCGSVYCLNCLFTSAPVHRSGGKACPKCGSTFKHLA